jgi:phenylalanyl-tRNA synthetase beta chain
MDKDVTQCTVPAHRLDVDREIDLIEEIVRVYGYAGIPTRHAISHPVFPEAANEKAGKAIRQTILAAGFIEAITVTFVDEAEANLFLPQSVGAPVRVRDAVRKASNVVRPSLLPSLLQVRRTNQNTGTANARVWEHSEVFWQHGDASQQKPVEQHVLSLVGNTVDEVHGALDLIAGKLGPAVKLKAVPQDFPWYAQGASAAVHLRVGKSAMAIGHFGQFRQGIARHYDLRHEAAGAEILWQPLLDAFVPIRQAKPLSTTQSVRRDLSVVVNETVRWAEIEAAIADAKLPFLESIDFVGTFRHKNIGEGKKSLTLTLEFRDPASTLRSEQVDTQVQTVVAILAEKVAATLRA